MPLKIHNVMSLALLVLTSGCAGFGGVTGEAILAAMGIPVETAIIRHGLIIETTKIRP